MKHEMFKLNSPCVVGDLMAKYQNGLDLYAARLHTLSCPVTYQQGKNDRLHDQLVSEEGSLSHVEGLILYALARSINAKNIIELGTYYGRSTNYLLAAAVTNGGRVRTVDNVRYWGGVVRGSKIMFRYLLNVELVKADARLWLLNQPLESADFIFEDTDHSYELTSSLICDASCVLRPGGILAIHDVAVELPECRVLEAVNDSGLEFTCLTCYPGLQGLAIWRKPK